MKEFFNGRAIVFVGLLTLILILTLGIFVHQTYFSDAKTVGSIKPVEYKEPVEPPVFTWKFEKDDSLNLDGQPQTNVFLEVKYSNGQIQNKLIDTKPGGCNNLEDSDEDTVPNSTNAQCYSAGLGYRYKITKGEQSYLVQRKTFEEALPDYNPPPYKYEVIAEFSF